MAVAASVLWFAGADRVVVPAGNCGAVGPIPARATSVVVDPRTATRALVTTGASASAGTVYRTTGGGACLVPSDDGLEPRPPFFRPTEPTSLAIDPSNPDRVYLGAVQGVFRSDDGGFAWAWRSIGIFFVLNEAGVAAVAIDPARPDVLYAGSWYGAFKSVNGGDSWFNVNAGLIIPPFVAPGVSAFAFDPRDTDILYAASLRLYRTTSGGLLWHLSSDGLPGGPIHEVVVDVVDPDVVYAGTENGVFRSSDAAGTWVPLALDGIAVYSLAQDERSAEFMIAGTDSGVFVTVDGGRTWNLVLGRPESGVVSNVAIAPSDSETLYAAAEGGLYASRDKGQTWSVFPLADSPTRLVSPR